MLCSKTRTVYGSQYSVTPREKSTMDAQEELAELFCSWRLDPVSFLYEGIGVGNRIKEYPKDTVTKQQLDCLKKVGFLAGSKWKKEMGLELSPLEIEYSKKIGISLRAGQGPGKTTVLAWICIWFLLCFDYSLIPAIAPKAEQLRTSLIKEIGVWLAILDEYGAPFLKEKLVVQSDKIYHTDCGKTKEEWALVCLTAKDTADKQAQGATLRGKHSKHMMVVMEEATGLSDGVFEPLEGTLTDDVNFAIMIFNPIKNSGYSYESHHSHSDRWITLHWSNEDCERLDQEKIKREEEAYGRFSEFFQVNRLGNFPPIDSTCVIPLEAIEDALQSEIIVSKNDPKVLGVDPAGLGKDSTVFCPRQGSTVGPFWVFPKMAQADTTNWLANYITDNDVSHTFIDSIGEGAGVYSNCKSLKLPVISVHCQERARDEKRFLKIRDELLWHLRDLFVERRISLVLDHPEIPSSRVNQIKKDLVQELSLLTYTTDAQGRIMFIKKRDMKKKLGRSPDLLDSLWMAFYYKDKVFTLERRSNDKFERYRQREMVTQEDGWLLA